MNTQSKRFTKFLIIMLVLACAAAFIPMTGPAFAAKKPARVTGVALTQAQEMTSDGLYDVNVKWDKVKKIRKYRVKVTDVTKAVGPVGSDAVAPADPAKAKPMVLKVKGKKCKTKFASTVGSTYKVKVRALKGKKMGKWSKAVQITIVDHRAAGSVTINLPNSGSVKVGDKLTAAVGSADAVVTWQWYRVDTAGKETAIDGATKAEYTAQGADAGYFLKVIATINAGDPANQKTAEAVTPVVVSSGTGGGTVVEKQPLTSDGVLTIEVDGKEVPVIPGAEEAGVQIIVDIVPGDKLIANGVPEDADVTWQWFRVNAAGEEAAIDGATKAEYTIQEADAGCCLKAVATASPGDPKYTGTAMGTSEEVLDLTVTVTAMNANEEIALAPIAYGSLQPETGPVKLGVLPSDLQDNIAASPGKVTFDPVSLDMIYDEQPSFKKGTVTGNLKYYNPSTEGTETNPWINYWCPEESSNPESLIPVISPNGHFLALNVKSPKWLTGDFMVCEKSNQASADPYEMLEDSSPYYGGGLMNDGPLVVPVKDNSVLAIMFARQEQEGMTVTSVAREGRYICFFDLAGLTLGQAPN